MPKKPAKQRINRDTGEVEVMSREASVSLRLRNGEMSAHANEVYLLDVEDTGTTQAGRYTRVLNALVSRYHCSARTARRAMQDAEILRAEEAAERLPYLAARVTEQLQRIADREEDRDGLVAVAALREICKIGGLYAPKKVEITDPAPVDFEFQIDAILGVLDENGQAAMRVVLAQMYAAEADGRLALAAGTGQPAPPDDEPSEPGAN